jgi:uncharacterized protein with LGFP repeats
LAPTAAHAQDEAATTEAPTTEAPMTEAPTTGAPVQEAPVTGDPTATDGRASDPAPAGDGGDGTDEEPAPPLASGATVVGELVVAWPEHEDPDEAHARAEDGPLTWVETADGRAVRLPAEDLADHLGEGSGHEAGDVPAGATVEVVVGREVTDDATREDGVAPARDVLAAEVLEPASAEEAPVPATTVTNEVTVVMVVPKGGQRDAMTLDRVVAAVGGPVAQFWREQSNGSIEIAVTGQHSWVDAGFGCSMPYELWDDVAGKVGFPGGPGKHLLLYIAGSPATQSSCAYGLATIGGSPASGGRLYARGIGTSVIAHEFGHNFGLGHSSALQCEGALESGRCELQQYRDYHDVMGISWDQVGSLNAPQAARLGFIPEDARQSMGIPSTPVTVALAPASGRTGTRAVRLIDAEGTAYWLEYRAPSGRDAWLATGANRYGLDAGVQLRRAAGQPDTSVLLDATPGGYDDWTGDMRVSLQVGQPVSISAGDFRITVENVTATEASVRVARGVAPTVPATVISRTYDRSGGPDGPLGYPTSVESCGLRDGGCLRTFDKGAIYWSPATGARIVHGAIHGDWQRRGAERSSIGYPVTDTLCGLVASGCYQGFQQGWVYTSKDTAPVVVRGGIRERWQGLGSENGMLGYPVDDERCGLPGGGCAQSFTGGSLVWSAATGARAVRGGILTRWNSDGADAAGYPVSDTICGLPAQGCYQLFQRGSVYVSAATGAAVVRGGIRERWQATGSEHGALGYPVTDEQCGLAGGGCQQQFAGGVVVWSSATGARAVVGEIVSRWASRGPADVGYPTTDTMCGLRAQGCYQFFERGSVYVSTDTAPAVVRGGIRERWEGNGLENGPLGYPTADEQCGLRGGGCAQEFLHGTITWSPVSGAQPVRGAIRDAWLAAGGLDGDLGYPVGEGHPYDGGLRQHFQGGTLTSAS